MTDCLGPALVVMTRLPRPGEAKTRLIPALGPEGAAQLQSRLTERLMIQARRARLAQPLTIVVSHTGNDVDKMRQWLGADLVFHRQAKGDIGGRMAGAFARAFAEGYGPVVLVGSDIPQLDQSIINDALAALDDHDLVLGPVEDGGYCLMGLNKPAPELFEGVTWSGPTVLDQTLSAAEDLRLSTHQAATLCDIDEPPDLALWSRIEHEEAATISVVIPALNEEENIGRTVTSALEGGAYEVIVVDGGSTDQTVRLAGDAGALVVSAPRGRAGQMNAGASLAMGRHLLFLHADTILPRGWSKEVIRILADPSVAAGAFSFQVDQRSVALRFIEMAVAARCALAKMPYGDQALFVSRELFSKVGGYPALPIMEDVELIRRLKEHGKIRISRLPAVTSARRWKSAGVFKTTLVNYFMMIAHFMKADPRTLRRIYDRIDDARPGVED